MQIFPTRYSTLSADALNEHIAAAYGLTDTTCKLLIRNVSDTYLLESHDEKYIFKIYRDAHRQLEEIKAELEILNILKVAGAKVAAPLTDLQQQQIQQFQAAEGIRNGVLFEFAAGQVVTDMNEEQLRTVGREIAVIHQETAKMNLNHPRNSYNITTTLTQPLETLAPYFKDMQEEYLWLKETAQQVIEKLNGMDTPAFSSGYCHYDFLPKNFHFDQGHNVTFFDFDFAGKGYLVNDLMTLYVHFFLHTEAKRTTPEQAAFDFETIVKAYREVRPLSDAELAAIPYLGYQFWLFYMEFHYLNFEDWSNFFLTPRFMKDRVALMKRWVNRYCDFSSQ